MLEQEQHAINDELRVLINQKIKDLLKESKVEYRAIIEKTYQELEDEKKQSILKLTQQIQELKKLSAVDIENSIKTNIEIFDDIINATVPSRKNLELILDKIIVYSDRTLEIKLKVNIEELIYKGVDST